MVGEVVGDVRNLATQIERDTERVLRSVDLDMSAPLRDLTSDFEAAFTKVEADAENTADDVTASFREIARDADRIFAEVTADAHAAGTEIGDDFQRGGEQAERAFHELRLAAARDFNAIERQAGQTSAETGGRFKAMAAVAIGALAGITAATAAGLGATTVFGLKAAAQLEQTAIGFEALLGSAEEAAKFLREVQTFAAETPFEFQGIADASRRILAFGTAVGITKDEVLPTIETIGSLVSVLGGGQFEIDSVTRALGQMASKGKISQEELLQLAEALPGFSANAAIAAGLGVSTAEAMEMISSGEVSAKEGIDLLLEGMGKFPGAAGAMAKQAGTLQGVFSTFKDTIAIALTDAFAPIIPQIKDALTILTPVLGQVIGQLAPAIGQVITAALPLAGVLLQAFTPVVVPILEILSKLLPTLTPPLIALGGVLGDLVEAADPLIQALGQVAAELIAEGLVPALNELIPQFVDIAPALADVAIALIPLIPPLGELLAVAIRMQGPLIKLVALFLEFAANKAVIPLVELFTENLTKFLNILTPFSKEFSKLENFPAMFDRAGESLSKLANIIGGQFTQAWTTAADVVQAGVGTVVTFIAEVPGKAGNALRALASRIRDAVTGAFRGGRDAASTGLHRLVSLVGEAPGRLRALGGRMLSAGRHLIGQFLSGLKRVGGFVGDVASGIAQALRSRLNDVIRAVNSGIAQIDAALPFGLPRIPELARGGFTQAEGLARLHPSELVLPLQDRRAVDLLAQAMAEASAGLRAAGVPGADAATAAPVFDVRVYVGDRELTDIVDVRITERDRRTVRRVRAGAGRGGNR